MTTRAQQIDLLTDPLIDPTTGSLCAGYTAYFYAAGTSTAKNVWTEKEKTNPFTSYALDSGGKALLYGDGTYKIVVKNTDGTTVLSLDNQKIQATTFSIVQKTGAYTATPDDDVILCSGTWTLSLQDVANYDHPLYIKNISTGTITIDPSGTQQVEGAATLAVTVQGHVVTLFPDTTSSTWRAGYTVNDATLVTYSPAVGADTDVETQLRSVDSQLAEYDDKFEKFYYVTDPDYGAVGDGDGAGGGTDDSAAIIACFEAVEAAGGNAKIIFPTAIYRIDSILGDYTFDNVEIDFGGSTLDCSNIATDASAYILHITGAYAAGVALTGNATLAQKTIALDSSTFAVGDFVKVYSDAIWDDSRTDTKIGELNFVETIPDEASITTTAELQSTYNTADTAKVAIITPVRNITIKNGYILGPAANDLLVGILITGGISCIVESMRIKDVDAVQCRLNDCIFSKVVSCHFEQSNHASQAYGLSFQNACQDCSAIGNSFVDVRHSMTTNNSVSTSWGITRRILFQSNVVSDSAQATGGTGGDAIDTHAGGEEIFIIGNTVHSSSNHGINFEARTGIIANNHIKNTANSGIYFNPRSDSAANCLIIGNNMFNVGSGVSGYGINCYASYADIANLVIANNRVSSNLTPINLTNEAGMGFQNVVIADNIVARASASAALYGIQVDAIDRGSITGNVLNVGAYGIVVGTSFHVSVNGNSIELVDQSTNATGRGIYLNDCDYCAVVGNTLKDGTDAVATTGVVFATTTTYSGIWNNVTEGFDTNVNESTGDGNAAANNI